MLIFEMAIKGVSVAVLQRFVRRAQKLARVAGEVDVLISSNQRLQALNRRFRRKNKPTDVLSFPRSTGGDIAISAQIACQNAARYGHGIAEELKILVLHGMLHLAGYDHEADDGEMARLESRLRAQLKLPASLIDRTQSLPKAAQKKSTRPKTSRAANATIRIKSARAPRKAWSITTPRKTKSVRSTQ